MTLDLVPWRGHNVPVLTGEIVRYTTADYINWLTSSNRWMGAGAPPAPFTTYGSRPAEPISTSFEGFVYGMLYADGPVAAVEAYRLRVFGQAPLLYQEFVDGRAGDLFDDDALERLRAPWPGATWSDLMKRSLIYGDFAGNAFITDMDDELVLLRPDWVEIVLEKRMRAGGQVGWRQVGIMYYEGGLRTGDGVPFLPGEYAHFVPGLPDPLATYRGMSWLTPLVREVQADKSAMDHKVAFFENAASPNLAVGLPKEITPKQFEDFVEKMDAQHKGALNAYKCLHPDTDVSMWDGSLRRAGDVVVGDQVVAWTGGKAVLGTVSVVEEQPASPIVTVTTQRGRVIKTNDRHPYLLKDGSWVAAIDLDRGDLLVTGLGFAREDGADTLTPYEAWVLGVLVGDGCMVSSTPVVSAWDEGVRARLAIGHELRHTGKGHDYRLLGVRALAVSAGIMGKRSWEKRVPPAVMTGSAKVKAAFLSGLIDTDGHISDPAYRRSAEIGITSTSPLLLDDVRHLLASLDVNSSVSQLAVAGDGIHAHDAWRLVALGNDQARKLAHRIDLACERKASRLATYVVTPSRQDRSRFDRVESVVVGAPEVTIGIEVAGYHTHVTGGVVTHNTLYTAGGADVTVIGSNMQQMDFSSVQGKGETRLANGGGVPPVLLSFSEGMQGSSLNAGNYTAAKRNFVDTTMRDLWSNFAGSVQQMDAFRPPKPKSRLWYDGRDIPFLHEDALDAANIQQTLATTITMLVREGFTADSAKMAVVHQDMMVLEHTGLTSVQLQPPGSQDTNGDGVPDAQAQAEDEYQQALDEFRAEVLGWDIERRRPYPGQRYKHGWIPVGADLPDVDEPDEMPDEGSEFDEGLSPDYLAKYGSIAYETGLGGSDRYHLVEPESGPVHLADDSNGRGNRRVLLEGLDKSEWHRLSDAVWTAHQDGGAGRVSTSAGVVVVDPVGDGGVRLTFPDGTSAVFTGPDDEAFDLQEAMHLRRSVIERRYYNRIESGHVGGGRFARLGETAARLLSDFLDGNGGDDPLKQFEPAPDKPPTQLRTIAKQFGITMPRRRRTTPPDYGAETAQLKKAILDDAKERFHAAKGAKSPEVGKPVRFTLQGSKHRDLDVGVHTEGGKVSLWEVSDSGQKRRRIVQADDLAGLQKWAEANGEPKLADWARKERGPTEGGGASAAPLTNRQVQILREAAASMNGVVPADKVDKDLQELHDRGLMHIDPKRGTAEITGRGMDRAKTLAPDVPAKATKTAKKAPAMAVTGGERSVTLSDGSTFTLAPGEQLETMRQRYGGYAVYAARYDPKEGREARKVEWGGKDGGEPFTEEQANERLKALQAQLTGGAAPKAAPTKATPNAARVATVAGAFHEDWRKTRRQTDGSFEPRLKKTKDKAWIAAHGTNEVDIANTSYADLPEDWQAENKAAAKVVVDILARRGGSVDLSDAATRREVGEEIHQAWLSRNDWARGGDLDVPFADLPADEQAKDLDQVAVAMRVLAPSTFSVGSTSSALTDAGDDPAKIRAIVDPLTTDQMRRVARDMRLSLPSRGTKAALADALADGVRRRNIRGGAGESIAESADKAAGTAKTDVATSDKPLSEGELVALQLLSAQGWFREGGWVNSTEVTAMHRENLNSLAAKGYIEKTVTGSETNYRINPRSVGAQKQPPGSGALEGDILPRPTKAESRLPLHRIHRGAILSGYRDPGDPAGFGNVPEDGTADPHRVFRIVVQRIERVDENGERTNAPLATHRRIIGHDADTGRLVQSDVVSVGSYWDWHMNPDEDTSADIEGEILDVTDVPHAGAALSGKARPAKKAAPAAQPVNLPHLRTLDPEAARDELDLLKVGTVDDPTSLKGLLKAQNLPVSGKKRDLVDRLVEHLGPTREERIKQLMLTGLTRAEAEAQLSGTVRPSGLPTDRKPESGDFEDLALRISNLPRPQKTQEHVVEILQDLNASELRRLARKFPGSVTMTVGENGSVRDYRSGLRIPDGLTLDEMRQWLAANLTEQRYHWRSAPLDHEDEIGRADYDDEDFDEDDDDPTLDEIQAMADEDDEMGRTQLDHDELRLRGIVAERAAGHDVTPGHDELHHYWTRGPGRARWENSPTPWRTLYALVTKAVRKNGRAVSPEQIKRWVSRWFIEVKHYAAGSDRNRVEHGKPPRGHRIGPG